MQGSGTAKKPPDRSGGPDLGWALAYNVALVATFWVSFRKLAAVLLAVQVDADLLALRLALVVADPDAFAAKYASYVARYAATAATIGALRRLDPAPGVEVLTPDFLRKDGAVEQVVAAREVVR